MLPRLTAAVLSLWLGVMPAVASDAVVNFNEIQYHPASGGEAEWVELHNQMSIRIDLSGWRLSGGIDFTFPEGTAIDPGAYLVIHGEGAVDPNVNALGPFAGQLDNAGESLRLRDRNDRVMDEIAYDDNFPWPVGPDGSGWTLAKTSSHSAVGAHSGWQTSLTRGGTPGSVNTTTDAAGSDLVLSEIAPGWVELWNRGDDTISLDDVELHSKGWTLQDLGSPLSPDAYRHIETPMLAGGDSLHLVQFDNQILDSSRCLTVATGRLPADLRWYTVDRPTPNEANVITLQTEIVINEIMYHFPPLYDRPETVANDFQERDEEWIELYNRSSESIDLSHWQLAGGVRMTFPEGTLIGSEEYLIVARDAEALRQKYPEANIIGDFGGKLSNSSEQISLLDHRGNLADEVHYFDSGRWPSFADGGGSSLELRDPWADNAVPEAWSASREEDKAEWVSLAYQASGREPVRSNNPDNFHEFLMGLVDAGEVLVDDVSVIEDPDGTATELMQNGSFDKRNIFSGEVTHWQMLGTHAGSAVEDGPDGSSQLRVRADGAIEHTYNNISSAFPDGRRLEDGQTYAISLRAKWVNGVPLLNTRLYLNRVARTHLLPVPEQLGSLGQPNSRSDTGNIGPTFDRFDVRPLAPKSNEAVTITIDADDPQGLETVTLHFRSVGSPWQFIPMTETSRQGSQFTGRTPGHASGSLLQFYVEAVDQAGARSYFPARGPDSRALLRVGSPRVGERDVNHVRLLMLPDEHSAMRQAEHAVSNGRVLGTLIENDEVLHFDVGIRLRSSPFGRRGNRTGYNVVLGKEQPYRGVHDSISIDRGNVMPNGNANGFLAVQAGAGVNELVVNQIAQRARGIPTTYEDVIFIETPIIGESSLAQARMARYGNRFLESQFPDGGQGSTHKFELIYYPSGTVDGKAGSVKGPYINVLGIDIQDMRDDKEAYRYNFIPTNNRDTDDFTGIIRMGEAFSSRTDSLRRERVPEAIDVDQWMRVFAFQSLIGVADTYNMGLAHNLVLYTRPSDGRVLAFPWDLDHAFYYSTSAALLGRGNTNLGRIIDLPEYKRLFYGHLDDIIKTAYDADALAPWIVHLNEVTENNYTQRFLDYIQARAKHVGAELQTAVSAPFRIITNKGNDFDTDQPTALLEGTGWINVRHIRNVATGALLDLTWTAIDTWQAEIPLTHGENEIVLQAVDFQGNDIGSIFSPGTDRITIMATGELESASSENLILSEIHYHPNDEATGTEFIELRNIGPHPIDLAGIHFTEGVVVTLLEGANTRLQPGEHALLVENLEAFAAHYGEGLPILGVFSGSRLNNTGEGLRLADRSGAIVFEIRYDDSVPWPSKPDGGGPSLVYRSGDPDSPFSWRSSRSPGGSPGVNEREPHTPDISFEEYAFGFLEAPIQVDANRTASFSYRRYADDTIWSLEGSLDLMQWEALDASSVEWLDRENTAEFVHLTFRLPVGYPFVRVRATTPD